MTRLLDVKNLKVSFLIPAGEVQAVRGVTFSLEKGESVAIVGESGCGKSVTAHAIMRLLQSPPAVIRDGSVLLEGRNLLDLTEKEMQKLRGNEIGMIFQDPMTSLNPTMKVGKQIAEGVKLHMNVNEKEAKRRALDMENLVGFPNPERRYNQYPHEFSGGMRQRAMIAMSLACEPKVLIADEPTTALDVTIQAQILELMKDIQKRLDTAIILITHDLGIVADVCHRVMVMYAGKIVESGSIEDIYQYPEHPYTWGLLKSVPRLDSQERHRLVPIPGQPPDLIKPPVGCAFMPRCKYALKVCVEHDPPNFQAADGHQAACWLLHPDAQAAREAVGLEARS
ncbi:MAG TPA: ABC transporter ATP-binding protein [Syntrophomonadaceae bacterium]|nr:ABC transporter ATP-binding protein [Syntrophomonadaceae bacterium]